MGDIAEDIIDGSCCALCGQYFEGPERNVDGADVPTIYSHGYPVACDECYEKDCGYPKAEVHTF